MAQICKASSRSPQVNLIEKLKLICQTFHFAYKIQKISLFGMILIRLKLHQFFNGVSRTFPIYKHGRGKRGQELEKFSKKPFSPFSVVKNKFHHF